MLVADMFGADRSPVVARIDRPTLVVASPRSFELEDQRETASRIPGADFRIVANAGHAVFFDQPAAFNALLRAFLWRQGL
jgi:non-heme chloroperoxidase